MKVQSSLQGLRINSYSGASYSEYSEPILLVLFLLYYLRDRAVSIASKYLQSWWTNRQNSHISVGFIFFSFYLSLYLVVVSLSFLYVIENVKVSSESTKRSTWDIRNYYNEMNTMPHACHVYRIKCSVNTRVICMIWFT